MGHGYSHHRHYPRWRDLNKRCYDPNDKQYADYGGRGITVCAEWSRKSGPKAFCNWCDASGFEEGLVIDRQNNDMGYSPENCAWVTRKESAQNRRPHKPYKKANCLPVGVRVSGRGFMARAHVGGKQVYAGTHATPEKAHEAYKRIKENPNANG